jgi:hypothetical protein
MEEQKALEQWKNKKHYQLAVKGKEKTEDEWCVQDLIDRARAIKGMEKIDWKSLDK